MYLFQLPFLNLLKPLFPFALKRNSTDLDETQISSLLSATDSLLSEGKSLLRWGNDGALV